LGLGHNIPVNNPTVHPVASVKEITAEYDHTLIIKQDGTLWGVGANDFYQINDTGLSSSHFLQIGIHNNYIEIQTGPYLTVLNRSLIYEYRGLYIKKKLKTPTVYTIPIPN
jgi:alpha-tubulin suppressor-like RCC1 family protein